MTMSALDPGQVLKTAFDDTTGLLKVAETGLKGTVTDRSGSATTSSSQVCAASSTRKYFIIQNLDTTNNLHVNFTSNATTGAGSFKLIPSASYVFEGNYLVTEAINVCSSSGTVAYTAKEA